MKVTLVINPQGYHNEMLIQELTHKWLIDLAA